MTEALFPVLVVAFLAAAVVAVAVIVRKMMRSAGFTSLLAPKVQKRLEVLDQATIDAKRKLVLIRRDNVEHLLLTGGPVDIVIETGIGATRGAGEAQPQSSQRQHLPHPLGVAAE